MDGYMEGYISEYMFDGKMDGWAVEVGSKLNVWMNVRYMEVRMLSRTGLTD